MWRLAPFFVILFLSANALFAMFYTVPSEIQRAPEIQLGPQIQTSDCPGRTTRLSRPVAATDYVELHRTACYGSCPTYRVRIQGNGEVLWEGGGFVHFPGAASSRIDPGSARVLIDKLRSKGFWNLCGSYSTNLADGSGSIIRGRIGTSEKEVFGQDKALPPSLHELEEEIDTLADTHRWIHGAAETETFAGVRTANDYWPAVSRLATDALGPKPGLTQLMKASAIPDVRRQLSMKADPNGQDASGWTALMYATAEGSTHVIRILLEAKADPNLRSHMGQTAIMAAGNYPVSKEALQLLLNAGADINAQDKEGSTALILAVREGARAEIISFMLGAGARKDLRDATGRTAFDYLDDEQRWPGRGDYEAIKRLLQK